MQTITAREVRERWGISRQRARDRMASIRFQRACPVLDTVDGQRVYSLKAIKAYEAAHESEWTATR